MQISVGQKLVISAGTLWLCWLLVSSVLGSSAEQLTQNHGYSHWYWWPLLFVLVPSYLCSPQLCQFLGGVKPKWVLRVMTWKLGRLAACLLLLFQENFLAGLSHLALSLGGQGEWDDTGKWSSTSFWVLLRFLLLLYYSGLSGLLSSPRTVFVPG